MMCHRVRHKLLSECVPIFVTYHSNLLHSRIPKFHDVKLSLVGHTWSPLLLLLTKLDVHVNCLLMSCSFKGFLHLYAMFTQFSFFLRAQDLQF